MTSVHVREFPRPNDVVYFSYLHLNTARDTGPSLKEGHRTFEIEGKERPFFVVSDEEPDRGVRWYLVAPCTTKAYDERRNKRRHHIPIDGALGDGNDSFVVAELVRYPDNLLVRNARGKLKRKHLEPLAAQSILRILMHESRKLMP